MKFSNPHKEPRNKSNLFIFTHSEYFIYLDFIFGIHFVYILYTRKTQDRDLYTKSAAKRRKDFGFNSFLIGEIYCKTKARIKFINKGINSSRNMMRNYILILKAFHYWKYDT